MSNFTTVKLFKWVRKANNQYDSIARSDVNVLDPVASGQAEQRSEAPRLSRVTLPCWLWPLVKGGTWLGGPLVSTGWTHCSLWSHSWLNTDISTTEGPLNHKSFVKLVSDNNMKTFMKKLCDKEMWATAFAFGMLLLSCYKICLDILV